MTGHLSAITALVISSAYAIIVSGSADGVAIVWDLNRILYVRTLCRDVCAVDTIAVSPATGVIVVCTAKAISVFTINGHRLLVKSLDSADESAVSATFWTNTNDQYEPYEILLTGHSHNTLRAWRLGQVRGAWSLECVKVLRPSQHGEQDQNTQITAILNTSLKVYAGNSIGKLFCWS